MAWAFAAGADFVTSARGFMFSLGCIQALKCNKNTCPTGITTHDPRFQKGLVPGDKNKKVARYGEQLTKEIETIALSVGVLEPRQLRRKHVRIVQPDGRTRSMAKLVSKKLMFCAGLCPPPSWGALPPRPPAYFWANEIPEEKGPPDQAALCLLDWREDLFVVQRLDRLLKIVLRRLLFFHCRQTEDMVHDLVFEQRRLNLLAHLRVLLNELEELPFLTRILTRLVHDRLGHLGVRHFDFGFLTQLGQQQPKPHAALGQLVVLVGRFDLGVVVALTSGFSSCQS